MVQVGDQGVPVIRAAYQRGLETAKAKYVRDAVLAESYAVGPLHAMAAIPLGADCGRGCANRPCRALGSRDPWFPG